jgi:hypothetical protein
LPFALIAKETFTDDCISSEEFSPMNVSPRTPGCLGHADPSGWINSDTFFKALQRFIKFVDSFLENPIFLLLDNHSSHLYYKVVSFTKPSGLHLLTFPPLCSHCL